MSNQVRKVPAPESLGRQTGDTLVEPHEGRCRRLDSTFTDEPPRTRHSAALTLEGVGVLGPPPCHREDPHQLTLILGAGARRALRGHRLCLANCHHHLLAACPRPCHLPCHRGCHGHRLHHCRVSCEPSPSA